MERMHHNMVREGVRCNWLVSSATCNGRRASHLDSSFDVGKKRKPSAQFVMERPMCFGSRGRFHLPNFRFATELEAFWYCAWLEHLWRVADEGASVPWLLLRVRCNQMPSEAMSFFQLVGSGQIRVVVAPSLSCERVRSSGRVEQHMWEMKVGVLHGWRCIST